MPKPKKPRSRLTALPDVAAIRRLFPKKVLDQVQAAVHKPFRKKSHA